MVQIAASQPTLKLLEAVRGYLTPADAETVQRAIDFAANAHGDQLRASGEPYITHPIAAALTLAELHLDAAPIVAALLHDVVEDTYVSLPEVERQFGSEVARLVDGVTKLARVPWVPERERMGAARESAWAENLRKMFLAMAEDLRVVLVKLADRLHNMQTLESLPTEKQQRIAQETMEIYAPLANRLGMNEIKSQLEDLSFQYLEPVPYATIAAAVQEGRKERQEYIGRVILELRRELDANGIQGDVFGRPKHLYS